MKIFIIPVTLFVQNCSLLCCEETGKTAVIDPGSDHATLIRSIREQLFPLGDDVQFIPGYGPVSTFGLSASTIHSWVIGR